MQQIYIVLNRKLKEYWVADLHYNNSIHEYVERLKNIYGKESIQYYPTDSNNLNGDIEIEEHRGFQKSHFANWVLNNKEEL